MNEAINNQNQETTVDEEIARMRESFKHSRFREYEGIERSSFKSRASHIRSVFQKEAMDNDTNGDPGVMEETLKTEFYPHIQELYEIHENAVSERLNKAKREMDVTLKKNGVQPGRMAARVRRSIDAKLEAEKKQQLTGEANKIKRMESDIKAYIKSAPEGSSVKTEEYNKMLQETLKKNQQSLSLASDYLNARVTRMKYEEYEKNGVITEGEKRILSIAKEVEEAAKLRLDNFKEYAHLAQEKDAALTLNSSAMKVQTRQLYNSADKNLALIGMPKEDPKLLLTQRLDQNEQKYYDALKAKRELKGFHPFKKMKLNKEIAALAAEFNKDLATFNKGKEEKDRRPSLTTLEDKESKDKQLTGREKATPAERENPERVSAEAKQTIKLDLGDKVNAHKQAPVQEKEKESKIEKSTPELDRER